MDNLVKPHGKEKRLKPLLLEGGELAAEQKKAESLNVAACGAILMYLTTRP